MHELSVCQALIEQVERVARENDARRVVSITIAVGPLSGVEPRLLEHAYPLAAAGTVAEHATLTVETVPVRVRCRTCGAETDAAAEPPGVRQLRRLAGGRDRRRGNAAASGSRSRRADEPSTEPAAERGDQADVP